MLETLELYHNLKLGFTYPCDGPGRGGTCQIPLPLSHHVSSPLFFTQTLLFPLLFLLCFTCLNVYHFGCLPPGLLYRSEDKQFFASFWFSARAVLAGVRVPAGVPEPCHAPRQGPAVRGQGVPRIPATPPSRDPLALPTARLLNDLRFTAWLGLTDRWVKIKKRQMPLLLHRINLDKGKCHPFHKPKLDSPGRSSSSGTLPWCASTRTPDLLPRCRRRVRDGGGAGEHEAVPATNYPSSHKHGS